MYLESERILRQIDENQLGQDLLAGYYQAYSDFYGHYAQSNNNSVLLSVNEKYKDSLLMILDPLSFEYRRVYAEKIFYQGQVDQAEKLLLELLAEITGDDPQKAIVAYLLGCVYKEKKDTDREIIYFSRSMITDLRNAIKDNASSQSLALTYDRIGDIDMAYKFMKSAIEDAVFCNVRFRTIETTTFFSIINNSYQSKVQKQKRELQRYLILISLLSAFLIAAIVYVYLQMRKISGIQQELAAINRNQEKLIDDLNRTNLELQEVNLQLVDANQIKEKYIAHFFDMCSAYINKLENYRKLLSKRASHNEWEELSRILRSTMLIDTEVEELYKNFDRIFLSLYPLFVEKFNALLTAEEQVSLKQGELLNTELRIFALIRLGIEDSSQIAEFLRYSVNTIYNYRAKVKNKARVSRDDFESLVKKIR